MYKKNIFHTEKNNQSKCYVLVAHKHSDARFKRQCLSFDTQTLVNKIIRKAINFLIEKKTFIIWAALICVQTYSASTPTVISVIFGRINFLSVVIYTPKVGRTEKENMNKFCLMCSVWKNTARSTHQLDATQSNF